VEWIPESASYDEIFSPGGGTRGHYERVLQILGGLDPREIARRERLQNLSLLNQGITFAVYGDRRGTERVFPFDFVPRIVPAAEWRRL
jgi:uncharacterized circularly permuted ATP-grasp superfamily protein